MSFKHDFFLSRQPICSTVSSNFHMYKTLKQSLKLLKTKLQQERDTNYGNVSIAAVQNLILIVSFVLYHVHASTYVVLPLLPHY